MRNALLPDGAAPMASGIKTFRSLRFSVLVFDTTSPSTRAAAWTAAGFTASRGSHPHEDLSRPPSLLDPRITGGWDWTGVSLSLTESLRTQPATGCFSGGWDRYAPYLAVIDAGCPAQVVLAHPPASLAPLGAASGRYPGRRIFSFQAARGKMVKPPHSLSR